MSTQERMLQELSTVHPYALDRYAQDRAEQLRQLAYASRLSARSSRLPAVRHAAGRMLVGLGERLLSDGHRHGHHASAL